VADRPVTHSRKDQHGDITALGNPNQGWSVRSSASVISDIKSANHTYYVPWTSGRTEIHVVRGTYGEYLRTDRDNTNRNNLDDLPSI
jgi:hypothetical protein